VIGVVNSRSSVPSSRSLLTLVAAMLIATSVVTTNSPITVAVITSRNTGTLHVPLWSMNSTITPHTNPLAMNA
jgi:hypothetical protein